VPGRILRWTSLLAGMLVFTGGCRKPAPAKAEIVGVMPLDNQSGDRSLDWIGDVSPDVIADQLEASPRLRMSRVNDRARAAAGGAQKFLAGYFTVEKGRLRLRYWLQQGASGSILRVISADAPLAGGVLAALDSAARQIDPAARPYVTSNPQALAAYAEARRAGEPVQAAHAFERAVQADPGFGPAYLAWGELAVSRRDTSAMEKIADLARAAGARLRPGDRAALDVQLATVRNDPGARASAIAEMARQRPRDPGVIASAAESSMIAHRFEEGAAFYRKLAALTPDRPEVWNFLGYAESLCGRLDAALEALRRYQKLLPKSPNPPDSIGDVYYNAGRLADAEKAYREAYAIEPAAGAMSLAKAAVARLASGDLTGAGTLFNQYLAARRQIRDPLADLREAQWLYFTGRRREALARVERAAAATTAAGVADQAKAQLALWRLSENQREAALKAASGLPDSAFSRIVRFLAHPPAPASEWAARAGRAFPDPNLDSVRQYALGIALLLDRKFAAAAPVWEKIHARANLRGPDDSAVLLAWARIETGNWDGVEQLLGPNGFPQSGGAAPFAFVSFPRVFDLRARLAEKQGRASEAAANRRIYALLSGQGK
jgi:tetratricopeptide (TPR) repeat protein